MSRNIEDKLKEFADSIREQAKEALCDFDLMYFLMLKTTRS